MILNTHSGDRDEYIIESERKRDFVRSSARVLLLQDITRAAVMLYTWTVRILVSDCPLQKVVENYRRKITVVLDYIIIVISFTAIGQVRRDNLNFALSIRFCSEYFFMKCIYYYIN